MDIGSPVFLILLIIGAFVMLKFMSNKKKIKTLKKENTRLHYEVSNQKLKAELRKAKDEDKTYRKNHGGEW